MRIRKATQRDLETLVCLYTAFFKEDGITTSVPTIRANLSTMLDDPRAIIWVVEVDRVVVGLASSTLTTGVEFGTIAELEDLYVIPSARGQGLSRKLIYNVSEWAEGNGASLLHLVITPEAESNQMLTAYYEKLGFHQLPRLAMVRHIQ